LIDRDENPAARTATGRLRSSSSSSSSLSSSPSSSSSSSSSLSSSPSSLERDRTQGHAGALRTARRGDTKKRTGAHGPLFV
jgi:hypothetical protein